MARICITGGIGAGKTALTDHLAARGWTVIDADVIAHEVTDKGEPTWQALRDAFGDAVLAGDGQIDRAFLADVAFHDPSALTRLNLITHTAIGVEIGARLASTEGLVAVALPLYRAEHRALYDFDEVWAVHVSVSTALARLVARGMGEEDARARLAVQSTNDERAALVDRVIENEGSLEDLHARVDELIDALVEAGDRVRG